MITNKVSKNLGGGVTDFFFFGGGGESSPPKTGLQETLPLVSVGGGGGLGSSVGSRGRAPAQQLKHRMGVDPGG